MSLGKVLKKPFLKLGKKVVHATLLRFPGGDSHNPIACTYCPEMCRFSCPTAVVSGNDAVTPCNKMSLLHKEERWPGRAAAGGQLWPLYDCTGCGRCTEYCVYEMPVADQLFAARAEFAWSHGVRLSDAQDPVGDLAEELGDVEASSRRLKAFVAQGDLRVADPRSVYFLRQHGHDAQLSWDLRAHAGLNDRAWLVAESVWLSRRLERAAEVLDWVERGRSAGLQLVLPYHHGSDCLDTGGEGAYPLMFASQARQMAREVWERDKHRAQGMVCFGPRMAAHLRASLGPEVIVMDVSSGAVS